VEKIFLTENQRRRQLLELFTDYDFLRVIGNVAGKNYVGIVSCLVEGIASDVAGNIFSERGIAVRAGLQCAPLAHKFLGTFPAGTVRFSVNCLTSDDDFAELRDVLDEIKSEL
jgi:selenocysteine lyase/cysteine desulfurase